MVNVKLGSWLLELRGLIMDRKVGQQEIVGFVLIVVLVVVGLMVFLIISLRDSPVDDDSVVVVNILDAVMKHTTECAVVYEPDYDNFEDLFKSCYNCSGSVSAAQRKIFIRPSESLIIRMKVCES